jgi:GH35 family endo-1,4-beta-xylanase
LLIAALIGLTSPARSPAQTTTLNGNALTLRSTGSAAGTAWNLDRDGYLGTYVTLSAPGNVSIDVEAQGTPSAGINPNMNVVIADTKAAFNVASTAGTYSHTFSLPAGTFFLRTEFNNDLGATPRQLRINNIKITGATVSNTNTSANALAASDTYIANYRQGPATVDLSALKLAPGTPVNVSLKRIAFDFGAGVHGSGNGIDPQLGNAGTAEQTSYQARLNQNFNTIVTAGSGYWDSNEVTQGVVTMDDANEVYAYAKAHDMHSRLHNMLFAEVQPAWVEALKTAAGDGNAAAKTSLTDAIAARTAYYVGNKSSQFNEIDVYNESYTGGQLGNKYTYWNLYGAGGIATIYNNAKLAAAGASYAPKLFVNDAGALSDSKYGNGYAQNIEALRQAALNAGYGEVVGGIGLQFYESGLRSNMPSQFIAALQNFNVSGLPTELTEFGTFNGVNAADSATILGQAIRLMFGNPGSTGFINWDWTLEDNGANQWAPAAGLYTVNTTTWDNWALTEAGKKWQDMLGIQDWDGNPKNGWTTQLNTTVDANGKIAFVGYYGDYQLTINGKVYNLSLVKGTSSYNLTAAIGDYNGDGIVDAADFTVWKDALGSHSDRRADGNGDGLVNQADFAVWQHNFGARYTIQAAASGVAVPEPSRAILTALALPWLAAMAAAKLRASNSALKHRANA